MCGRLMRVIGHSMEPALHPGDLVWVEPFQRSDEGPHSGEIVVARPGRLHGTPVIKRLAEIVRERNEFILRGDNPADSTDSRTFGPVTRQELVGRIRLRVWPVGRLAQTGVISHSP